MMRENGLPIMGCVADDFTGATDIANNFTISGLRTILFLNTPEKNYTGKADVLIVALKIRSVAVEEAKASALQALEWLIRQGCSHFYWKYCSTFDSTAKGNIGPVAEVFMERLKIKRTVYCPSFPENKRSVYMGNLFVGSRLLHESGMENHPLNPMKDASLQRLLKPQTTKPSGLINWNDVKRGASFVREKMTELSHQNIPHIVVDAIENADLDILAESLYDEKLLTGGSGLAWALPKVLKRKLGVQLYKDEDFLPLVSGKTVIFAGSASLATRGQLAYAKKEGIPAIVLDDLKLLDNFDQSIRQIIDWWTKKNMDNDMILIHSEGNKNKIAQLQEILGEKGSGELLEETFALLARRFYDLGIRKFIVAGGETSGAVVQALGISSLRIGAQIAPGVPWTSSDDTEDPLLFALKSGNFGNEDFFIKARDILK